MTIDVTITGKVYNAYGQPITGNQTVETEYGRSLIQAKLAVLANSLQVPLNNPPYAYDASHARTAAQLAAAPTPNDIVLGGEFFLDTDPSQRYAINAARTAYTASGGGGGTWGSIGGTLATQADLNTRFTTNETNISANTTALANKLSIPTAWAATAGGGTSPTISSGSGVAGTALQNTTAGYTTFTTPVDGIPGMQFNDIIECLVAPSWTLQPALVQSAAQIAAGATTGVVAQDASKNLYYADGTAVTIGGSAPSTTNVLKGNGSGGISTAAPGTDYLKPAVIQCGIAIGLPPSGSTVGASGAAFTSAVAFDQIYSSGVWLRFNAAEIAAGQAAGFFWVVMSSTTAGTVYNNTYTPGGSFAPPGSPTAFTTNAGGTTAGTIASIQALNYSMPSATLGVNGVIRYSGTLRHNNSAGSKQLIPYIGATNSAWFVCSGTTSIGGGIPILAWNTGVANRQIIYAESGLPVSTVSQIATIDTASGSAVSVALNLKTGTATDYAIMVLGKIEIFPA